MEKLSFRANLLWNSIGSFTYLLCQWLLTFLVVRMSVNFENAGNLSLAISITNIFYNLACFNIRPYLVSDLQYKYSVDDYTSFRIVTCFVATLMCIGYIFLFDYSVNQIICIILFMIYKIGEAIVDLLHSFEQRKSRMDIGGISLFCRGILTVISFCVGLKLFNNINIAIISMIFSTGLFIFFFDFSKVKNFEKLSISFNKGKMTKLFLEFLPLTVGSFVGTMSTSLPRQFLETISGTDVLGVYATVATPAVIVQVASSYIYNPLLVYFGEFRNKGQQREFKNLFFKSCLVILLISIICVIFSIFFAEWGLQLLFGNKIASYAYLFIPVIIYTSINGFMWFCHNILVILRMLKIVLFVNLTGFILCVLFSKALINNFGMNGVSYSLIFFTLIMIAEMLVIIFYKMNRINDEDNC